MLYQKLLRPILFKFDPEFVHNRTVALGEFLGKSRVARAAVRAICSTRMPSLPTTVAGIQFRNPIGLAAGFDKDARLLRILPEIGFGFMEVGAVTRHPCPGNPGKRLLRLPRDKSIIVYYGLKNIGAEAVRNKLAATPMPIPLGVNIAKTNLPHIRGDKSIEDYLATYRLLAPLAAYVTLNISCPNTQDGCTFQDPHLLRDLLQEIGKEKKYG
ncbi:quinone-dependent dihydroorotate dehydrogenase, partial [Candidatus Parcubacteria bacterium]